MYSYVRRIVHNHSNLKLISFFKTFFCDFKMKHCKLSDSQFNAHADTPLCMPEEVTQVIYSIIYSICVLNNVCVNKQINKYHRISKYDINWLSKGRVA